MFCTPKSGFRIHCQTRPVTMKRQRKGIEEDGAERVLEADLLVQQHGQQEADDEA